MRRHRRMFDLDQGSRARPDLRKAGSLSRIPPGERKDRGAHCYLTCNPFCRRICSYVGPELSAAEPDDDEGIEQVETDSWNNELVMEAMSGAWFRKKVRHPWLGGPRRLTMYLATVD